MNKFTKIALAVACAGSLSTTAVAQEDSNVWSGQGEAGFVKASGNTENETLNIGLNFKKGGELLNHEIKLGAFQASNSGSDTADSLAADYILKRVLSERSNVFFTLGYLDDDFDGFTEQYSASVGYGYKVIDRENTRWETGAGIGYRDTSTELFLADGSRIEGEDVSGATFVLRSDFAHKLTSNTEFVDSFKAEIGSDNSFIENDAALYVAMNDRFSLKAGILVRYNSDPAPDVDETDTITSVSLVYKFNQ